MNVVLPSLARAEETYNSASFASGGRRGIRLYVDATIEVGTATLDVKLQGRDVASGDWVDVPGASFAQISAVTAAPVSLTVYPGVAETANESVSDVVPSAWRVVAVVGGTSVSVTFSVGADLLP